MISIIIPVLNEAEMIASVVELVRRDSRVDEVLVIDDGSIDGTPELARRAGATVLTSTLLGKGASMEDGLWAARNEMLLYLDGDLSGLCEDLVDRMTRPLLEGQADFVKAKFSRAAGRVTTLTARPLLRTFFPELAHFSQPLGGIVAARRSLLRRLHFENDYGVDIGLLLDVAVTGARLAEVNIGHLNHDSHPLEYLGRMATQVARTILERAARYGRLHVDHIRDTEEAERLREAELATILQNAGTGERLALFDMDGTLLQGRFILCLAHRTNKAVDLAEYLDNHQLSVEERSRRIAALFAGVPREVFEETARTMPLMPGAAEIVAGLRKAGYRVGIVTDSYCIAAEMVRRRVFADFRVAHHMKFRRGKATGEVLLSPALVHEQGCPCHASCKVNLMYHLMEKMCLERDRIVAVGDGSNDICLLKAAGKSVAFQPKSASVQAAGDHVVHGDLLDVLALLQLPEVSPEPSSLPYLSPELKAGAGAEPHRGPNEVLPDVVMLSAAPFAEAIKRSRRRKREVG